MIDRKALVQRHNIRYSTVSFEAPIQLGNGRFCLSVDITGAQSLYKSFDKEGVPLCTMAERFWNSYLATEKESEAVKVTHYEHDGRDVVYAQFPQIGNEAAYNYKRQNPHKYSLSALVLQLDGEDLDDLSLIVNASQELDLFSGILKSDFSYKGKHVSVTTWVSPFSDTVCFAATSDKPAEFSIKLVFGRPSHRISGVEYSGNSETGIKLNSQTSVTRSVPGSEYSVLLDNATFSSSSNNEAIVSFTDKCSISFALDREEAVPPCRIEDCIRFWADYWMKGGMVDFSHCRAKEAFELERRVILSQYLTRINSTGCYPPSETGLFCNSWYGKFHLEMVPLHILHFPYWKRPSEIHGILDWYKTIASKARDNALINGYSGLRWPKMTDPEGNDSPSTIATLLIWQQPHILLMLDAVYLTEKNLAWLSGFSSLIYQTAEFMVSFLTYEKDRDRYSLLRPIIPVQEVFPADETDNPSFECQYWREGLEAAFRLLKETGTSYPCEWEAIAQKIALPSIAGNLYVSAETFPDSFERYSSDHPSMVFPLGFLKGEHIDNEIMKHTLFEVMQCWDYSSLWGWDFAFLAMCAVRLNLPDLAIDLLLAKTDKNYYASNGCNYQKGRNDLPSYLPGNGSLLLAVGMMCAGFDGAERKTPGFPDNGEWDVEYEDIERYVF